MKTCSNCYFGHEGTCNHCAGLPEGATTEISMDFTCDNWKERPEHTFVMGDIHGAHKALLQCLERSGFNKEKDELIVLGDTADGWHEVKQCFDELLTCKHLIYVIGNHDKWFLEWAMTDAQPWVWVSQGGNQTMRSYGNDYRTVPPSHVELLKNANLMYLDEENRLFVHGGINLDRPFDQQKADFVMWDRDLLQRAYKRQRRSPIDPSLKVTEDYKEIFVGHTTTQLYHNATIPLQFCNLWDLDTGAGWSGKLTMMNVDTKQYWQSDHCYELYPDEKGRHG
jgi:serine/threonine protein phosphatase 1